LISLAVVLAVWQLVGSHFPYASSDPTAVLSAFKHTVGVVIPAFRDTLETFGIGFAICIVVGIPVGLLMARSTLVRVILEPYNTAFYSTPFLTFFPVLILAFGVSFGLRIGCVILTGLFPVIINTYLGAKEVDANLVDVGRVFAARPLQALRTIIIPDSLPYIFAGIRLGFARGMIGAVVIELEASAVGIGYLLSIDAQSLQIANYFVVIILLGIFSMLCSYLFKRAERWATMPWSRSHALLGRSDDVAALDQTDALTPAQSVGAFRGGGAFAKLIGRRGESSEFGETPLKEYVESQRHARLERYLEKRWVAWIVRLITFMVFIGAWQLYSRGISQAVLPSPAEVGSALYHLMFVSGAIWSPLGSSCEVLLISFAIVLVIGIPIGVAVGRSRIVENVVDPYVSFLYALPHVAFVPLMVVWLGFGMELRIAYAVFSGIFAVIINTTSGVKSVDQELISVGRSFCATERQSLRTIIMPASSPFIVAGARQAFSMVWVGVVVAELLATESGIGGMITNFSNYFLTADMIVPVLFIMAISLVIVKFSTWLQPRLTPWSNEARL
jgi:NitT/TauT family transport system permease protein